MPAGAQANEDILTVCPHCGEHQTVRADLIGRERICQCCARSFEIAKSSLPPPGPEAIEPAAHAATVSGAPPTAAISSQAAGAAAATLADTSKPESTIPDAPPIQLQATSPVQGALLTASDGIDSELLGESRTPKSRTRPPSRAVGDRIADRFELTESLGEGGMGSVYGAHDHTLGRKVAVKFLTHLRPDLVDRFRAEARTVAAFDHPNIVRIYDFGNDSAGPYIIMELLHGRDLASVLDDERLDTESGEPVSSWGGLTSERVLDELMGPVASALDYSHERGVVHRDIKPSNVLLTDGGTIKVLDFGLARMDESAGGKPLTIPGQGMGTPSFSAPEQFLDARSVGPRADVYSFAATCYNLLTGQVPRIVKPEALPPGWRNAISKALDDDPTERPESATALLEDVRSAEDKQAPTQVEPGQQAERGQPQSTYVTPSADSGNMSPVTPILNAPPTPPTLPHQQAPYPQTAPGGWGQPTYGPQGQQPPPQTGYAPMQQPYAQPPFGPYGTPYPPHPPTPAPYRPPQASATAALVWATLGSIMCPLFLVFGIVSATKQRKLVREGRAEHNVLLTVALWWNIVALVAWAVVGLLRFAVG